MKKIFDENGFDELVLYLSSWLPRQTLLWDLHPVLLPPIRLMSGTTPRFQMRVFPWCTHVLACLHKSSCNTLCTSTVRSGVVTTHRLSRKARVAHCCQSRMLSKTEQHGHERIALLPTLSLENVVDASEIILPQESGRLPVEHSDEG